MISINMTTIGRELSKFSRTCSQDDVEALVEVLSAAKDAMTDGEGKRTINTLLSNVSLGVVNKAFPTLGGSSFLFGHVSAGSFLGTLLSTSDALPTDGGVVRKGVTAEPCLLSGAKISQLEEASIQYTAGPGAGGNAGTVSVTKAQVQDNPLCGGLGISSRLECYLRDHWRADGVDYDKDLGAYTPPCGLTSMRGTSTVFSLLGPSGPKTMEDSSDVGRGFLSKMAYSVMRGRIVIGNLIRGKSTEKRVWYGTTLYPSGWKAYHSSPRLVKTFKGEGLGTVKYYAYNIENYTQGKDLSGKRVGGGNFWDVVKQIYARVWTSFEDFIYSNGQLFVAAFTTLTSPMMKWIYKAAQKKSMVGRCAAALAAAGGWKSLAFAFNQPAIKGTLLGVTEGLHYSSLAEMGAYANQVFIEKVSTFFASLLSNCLCVSGDKWWGHSSMNGGLRANAKIDEWLTAAPSPIQNLESISGTTEALSSYYPVSYVTGVGKLLKSSRYAPLKVAFTYGRFEITGIPTVEAAYPEFLQIVRAAFGVNKPKKHTWSDPGRVAQGIGSYSRFDFDKINYDDFDEDELNESVETASGSVTLRQVLQERGLTSFYPGSCGGMLGAVADELMNGNRVMTNGQLILGTWISGGEEAPGSSDTYKNRLLLSLSALFHNLISSDDDWITKSDQYWKGVYLQDDDGFYNGMIEIKGGTEYAS